MESNNMLENKQRINILKKIILSYLEQYMIYQLDQRKNSVVHFDGLIEDRKLKSLLRVLSRGLLLNVEQFIKSRKWMNDVKGSSIKNITITSLNIIPEEDQENNSNASLVESEDELKQVSSSQSLMNTSNTFDFPREAAQIGECFENYNSNKHVPQNCNISDLWKYDSSLIYENLDTLPGFILGKLNFISLSLDSINKLLTNSASLVT